MRRAIVTVGLGFGDEGKGAAVDFLCRRHGADLVVRYSGGSQAGHNVQLPDGRRHTFSQFGAGTLAGVPTYLAAPVVLHLTALLREAAHLEELGIADPFRTLTVHPRCLVSTWLHQTANQLRELARGDARHGSCGHGIGETRSYWLQHGDDAVFARDLRDSATLREKLELLRQRFLLDMDQLAGKLPRPAGAGGPRAGAGAPTLAEYDLLGITANGLAEPLLEVGASLRLAEELPEHTTAVYEGAQGVLLDEWFGFHPHTTWSTVTAHYAIERIVRSEAEEVCVLGLTRAYTTRHGAGPLPSYEESLTASIRDEGNPWNRWQGSLRAGWLDLVLLRYAARACAPIDNLGVSCLDHLGKEAQVCIGYDRCEELPLPPGPDLAHQERLTSLLKEVAPVYLPATKDSLLALVGEIAPVALAAHGPTHLDRDCTPLRFRKRVRTTPSTEDLG